MSEHIASNEATTVGLADLQREVSRSEPTAPTGKPYRWQLPEAETPELVALPPEALAERPLEGRDAFRDALERTAALFIVVARNNGYEGREPALITDGLDCGAVSGLLGIDIDMLARVLLEMRRRGLVTASESGELRLADIDGLDRLSDGL